MPSSIFPCDPFKLEPEISWGEPERAVQYHMNAIWVIVHYITTLKVLLCNAVVSSLVCRCASMDDSLIVELC